MYVEQLMCRAKIQKEAHSTNTWRMTRMANMRDGVQQPRRGLQPWYMDLNTHAQHLASIDLIDRCRPTAAKMVLQLLVRAADHGGTIR